MMLNYLLDEQVGLAKFAASATSSIWMRWISLILRGRSTDKDHCLTWRACLGEAFIEAARKIDKTVVVYKSNNISAGRKGGHEPHSSGHNVEDLIDAAFEDAGIIRSIISGFLEVARASSCLHEGQEDHGHHEPGGGFSVITATLREKRASSSPTWGRNFYDVSSSSAMQGRHQVFQPAGHGAISMIPSSRPCNLFGMHSDKWMVRYS
jgi:hypothetical protein